MHVGARAPRASSSQEREAPGLIQALACAGTSMARRRSCVGPGPPPENKRSVSCELLAPRPPAGLQPLAMCWHHVHRHLQLRLISGSPAVAGSAVHHTRVSRSRAMGAGYVLCAGTSACAALERYTQHRRLRRPSGGDGMQLLRRGGAPLDCPNSQRAGVGAHGRNHIGKGGGRRTAAGRREPPDRTHRVATNDVRRHGLVCAIGGGAG